MDNKVLPRLELGLLDSKSRVITNYTTKPFTGYGDRTHDLGVISTSLSQTELIDPVNYCFVIIFDSGKIRTCAGIAQLLSRQPP